VLRTTLLFVLTALAEIVGCYLPYLWLREGKSPLLLIPAAFSLALFAWLLTLHPTAAGRVYAAYGAVYFSVALVWLRVVDGVPLTLRDLGGVVVVLAGMGVLMGGGQRGG
jgi:small multidrug resistance family-3 protein